MKSSNGAAFVQDHKIKNKVLFIMGSTGTGKSKLAIDIATHFPSEIINSDKVQIFKGLDIVTNKMPGRDQRGVPHHLLSIVDSDADYTVDDFCRHVHLTLTEIINRGQLPIIVGGSNTYIQGLVQDSDNKFLSQYECCFIWLDVSLPILNKYLLDRVDQMVEEGMVEEARREYVIGADYSRGIRMAIGAPELDMFLRAEMHKEGNNGELLKIAIQEIKDNTCALARRQLKKIHRLRDEFGWKLHRIDATAVFDKRGKGDDYGDAWVNLVFQPSLEILSDFLKEKTIEYGKTLAQGIGIISITKQCTVQM